MKKLTAVLFIITILLSFAGCNNDKKDIEINIDSLAAKLASDVTYVDALEKLDSSVVAALYGNFTSAEKTVVYAASGATPEEIIIGEYASAEDAKAALELYNTRLSDQKNTFDDYNPEYRPLLDTPLIKQVGRYVVYCVSSDYDKSAEVLKEFTK